MLRYKDAKANKFVSDMADGGYTSVHLSEDDWQGPVVVAEERHVSNLTDVKIVVEELGGQFIIRPKKNCGAPL